jgi:hypothetical protein
MKMRMSKIYKQFENEIDTFGLEEVNRKECMPYKYPEDKVMVDKFYYLKSKDYKSMYNKIYYFQNRSYILSQRKIAYHTKKKRQ